MNIDYHQTIASTYLHTLTTSIPNRCTGSLGNRMATDFFSSTISAFGFQVEHSEFACLDWEDNGARFSIAEEDFAVHSSPFSNGCRVEALICSAATPKELETIQARDSILLLHGELAKEQLMPKKFPFYNPEEHQKIIRLLETKQPLAIITATSRNPELAGALYPFPLIEDGDFDIPSAYMTEDEGTRAARLLGETAQLEINTRRIPSRGCNVIACKGLDPKRRIVVCAHIDTKRNTPGALDNACGVTVLLLLAELLRDYHGQATIEMLAMNGEDYYAASGEIDYLKYNQGRLNEIELAINLDAVGYQHGKTAYSLYGCPPVLAAQIQDVLAFQRDMLAGEAWYQGDHMVFKQNGIPALALTSENFIQIETEIAHTPKDNSDQVDPAKLVDIALALRALITELVK